MTDRINNSFIDLNQGFIADDDAAYINENVNNIEEEKKNENVNQAKINSQNIAGLKEQTTLNASSKNLANAFIDLLKGNKVPSNITITNPDKGTNDPKLQQALAKAAVKVATALLTSQASNKEMSFGFQVGDFTVEMYRDTKGKFSVTVEGMPDDNGTVQTYTSEVNVNDVDGHFASRIAADVIENYEGNIYEKGKFSALAQLIVAGDEGGKSPFPREFLAQVLKIHFNVEAKELEKIGLGTILHLAAQKILDPNMKEKAVKAELKRLSESAPILVNSPEAAHDIKVIQDLLIKNPAQLTSKVNIDNIGVVRSDPQQGMGLAEKTVHNLIADLFMPEDSSLFDNTDGQAGKRVQQILLKHPQAIKLIIEDIQQKGTIPFETLPEEMRKPMEDIFVKQSIEIFNNYMELQTAEGKEALSKDINKGKLNLDINLLKTAITQVKLENLAVIDKIVEDASNKLAVKQQQLITDKFNSSLQNNAKIKSEEVGSKPFYEVDIREIVRKHVKTPPVTAEDLANNPEEAQNIQNKRYKEYGQAFREILITYKKPILALLQIEAKEKEDEEKEENGEEINPDLEQAKQEYNDNYTKNYNTIKQFNSVIHTLKLYAKEQNLSNWFSKEGLDSFDRMVDQKNIDILVTQLEHNLEIQVDMFVNDAQNQNMSKLQEEILKFKDEKLLDAIHVDINSQTLKEMSGQPDDFDKPGMGQLIKNVLTSYFSSSIENKDKKDIREIDKRSMIASMVRYSDNNASQATQLGAMLKGAGPLMHKLLQGLELPGMDPEFKLALEDMKSNLNPIDPAYVQSQMLKMVNNSNGSIEKLTIEKPLGAASVGQAFLVKVTPTQGEPYIAVLKVIRPDVKVKTQREYEQFMAEASKIPGMSETYKGIYEQYKKEFDLTLEASNIKLGQENYNDGIDMDRVKTMELVDGAPVSETSMLIKQAPGTTLDSYIKETKDKIEKLKNSKFKTYEEMLAIKRELKTTYMELKDINKSLGVTAKKWINKSLFGKNGFFHGDMHAGNLMVKPGNPNITDKTNPESKSVITIIDYGNASKLDENQTKALLKVNVSTTFGGLYQFDANAQEKPYVETNTLDLFVSSFKELLTPEEQEKFKAREKDLVDNIIKPILLKGTKEEVGERMNLLIKKLQEAGVAIPGAVINMAESEKRLSNSIDEVNALMNYITDAMDNIQLDNTRGGLDAGGLAIRKSYNDTPITKRVIEKIKAENNYDLGDRTAVTNYIAQKNIALPKSAGPEEIKNFKELENKVLADNKTYVNAEVSQMGLYSAIVDCFSFSEDELWDKREVIKDYTNAERDKKIELMSLGNYFRPDKTKDELHGLHEQFLLNKSKVNPDDLKELKSVFEGLHFTRASEEERTALRQKYDLLSSKPEIKTYLETIESIKKIIVYRMTETLENISKEFKFANPIKNTPELNKLSTLTSSTIEVVTDKLSGEDGEISLNTAKNFANEKLGISTWDLLWNTNNKRDYFRFIANHV